MVSMIFRYIKTLCVSFTNRKIKEYFGLFYWWKCNARFDGNERPSKRDVNFASEK